MPKDWKPTLNPEYDVISGKVGTLATNARSLINPGVPSVLGGPSSEPL